MLNRLLSLLFFFISLVSWSQEINVYHLISENKKNPTGFPFNSADFIFLNGELKLTSYSIFHFTPNSIPDTIWRNKKKEVVYKNSKMDCDFSLNSKFERLLENHEMKAVSGLKRHLIISTANLNKVSEQDRFIVHEIDSDSEIEIQRELTKIKSSVTKGSCHNVYVYTDKYQIAKPSFSFTSDSLVGNGEIELKFTSSSNAKKINWSSNVRLRDNDQLKPFVALNSSQVVTATYVDDNGCVSNEDQIKLIYKASCNCEVNMGKPDILYHKSKNILDKNDEDEALWDYKAIPEQSGSLVYELPVKNVCGERFLVEIKSNTGKIIFSEYYEREDVDERSLNPIAIKNKEILVFIIPLDEHRNLIESADSYFYVSVTPEIDGEECLKRKFTSVKIRFSKCR